MGINNQQTDVRHQVRNYSQEMTALELAVWVKFSNRRKSLLLFLSLAVSFRPSFAQVPPAPTGNAKKSQPAQPKLTAAQERGLRLLKAAEGEAAGLAPDMRAFVLWRA